MALEENSDTQVPEAGHDSRRALPFGFAKQFGVLLGVGEAGITHIMHLPGVQTAALIELQRHFGLALEFQEVDGDEFNRQLSLIYEGVSAQTNQIAEDVDDELDLSSLVDSVSETSDLLDENNDAPIIRLINAILLEAVKLKASDVHVETFKTRVFVRYRLDGMLQDIVSPRKKLAQLLVSRIKVMAKLDIAEKRVPQDGRISLRIAGREVDVRVSTMPTSHGERIVLRLLDRNARNLTLSDMGMTSKDQARLREIIYRPHGIILVTGPTGSGKTTSLYAALSELNERHRNILSIEDPVEYDLEGVGQTPVNIKAGMTFAKGLRAILRQDPDVIMIGEIRDAETVQIAVQSSLTGHLVLSTLHTNSATGAITRLFDMGVEPFLVSATLLGVVAQRLVRTLCDYCKESHAADIAECELLNVSPANPPYIYKAVGCPECNHRGFTGRTGLYELVIFDEHLRKLVHNQASESELETYVREHANNLLDDGREKVLAGVTTVEEVLRVTQNG